MLELATHPDHAVLFSGDSDFSRLVEAMQRLAGCAFPLFPRSVPARQWSPTSCAARPTCSWNWPTSRRSSPADRPSFGRVRCRCATRPPNRSPIRPTPRDGGARRSGPGLQPVSASWKEATAPPIARRIPDWHNAPVPSFGDLDARLLVVGLAPGVRGANRTGRPFTGDFAGVLLYQTLPKFGSGRSESVRCFTG